MFCGYTFIRLQHYERELGEFVRIYAWLFDIFFVTDAYEAVDMVELARTRRNPADEFAELTRLAIENERRATAAKLAQHLANQQG